MATDIVEQFKRVVFRNPMSVSLDTKVLEAMVVMGRKSNPGESNNRVAPEHHDIASTDCVIVVDQKKIVGLLTAKDLLSFAAQQLPIEQLTLREVITHKPITAKESALTDLPSLLDLFEQHQIRHLPILDEQDCLAGLISYESLLRRINAIATERTNAPPAVEERWKLAFSGSKDGIWDWDLKSNIKFFSSRWKEIRGFRDEEIGNSPEECLSRIHPEDYERVLAVLSAHLARETELFECEYRARCKDGSYLWVLDRGEALRDEAGQAIRLIGSSTDITARKSAELALQEKQAQFQHMTENVPGMIFRYVLHPDKTDELTYVSSQIREVFELEPEAALQSANLLWERVHPDDVPWILEARQVSADTLQPMTKAYRLCLPKKGLRWVRNVSHVERLANGDVVWDGIAIDITDRKQQEQERERLLKILESTSDYIGVASAEGYILWHNQAFKNFRPDLGYSTDRIHLSVANPAWAYETMQKEAFPTAIEQGTWSGESMILDADGNEVPVSQVLIAHKSEAGEVEYFSTIIRDISDRKAIERQLEFTQYGLDHAADCFYCLDEEAQIKQVNQATCQRTGYTQEELLSMTLHELTPTCSKEKTWKPHWEKLKHLRSYSFESVQRTKTGEIFPVEVVCNYLEFDGKAYDFELIRDITARKAVEAKNNQHLAAIEAAANGIAILQADRYVYLNNAHISLLGYAPEELLGQSWRCLYSAEVLENFEQEVWPLLEQEHSWEGELVATRKDGSCFDQSLSLTRLNDDFWICVFSDISDRKATEKALALKQNHLEALLNNIPHMAWIKDEQSRFIAVNQPFAEASGGPAEELVDKSDHDVWPPELAQAYRDDDLQVLQSGQRKVVEEELSRSDGTVRWLETTKTPFRDARGELAGTVGIAADITDRKIAELALKDSQAQFQSMTENIPGMVYRYILHTDGSDELTYVSSQVREIFEVEPETALQDTASIWDRIHPDDISWLGEAIQVSAKTLQPFTSAYRLILPNKGLRWVQNMSHTERRNNGDVVWDGVVFDISVRIRTEAEQQRQLAILANTSDFIGTADPNGKVLYLNEAWRQLLQKKQDEPASRINISEQHPGWALEIILNEALPEAASQGMWCGETALLGGNGQEIPVSQVVIAHKSSDGEVEYFSTIVRDISEQKKADQQLKALSERLDLALEGAQIGVWQWDYQSKILSWDDRMFSIYGVKPEDFSGTQQDWLKHIHPDDLAGVQENVSNDQSSSDKEFRIIRSDGTVRYLFSTILVQQNDQGEFDLAVGINLDITDRKRAEMALEKEALRRAAIFNASPDGIHILDRAGHLMEANAGFAKMLGYSLEELSHLNVADWDAQWSKAELQVILQSYSLGIPSTFETLHRRKDGVVFPVEISECSMEWNGELALVCISRNISERRRHEIQLQQTNDELARATRLKDEFLANMSHELRTPLNSILGFSEALKEQILGPLSEKQVMAVNTIERSGEHLLKLINDILDVAKIESGKIELDKQPINISQVCNSGVVFVKQQAMKKNVRLTTNIPPNLPEILIDERRILQVLINLLDNAVKFTPNGGEVTLEISYQEKNREPDQNDVTTTADQDKAQNLLGSKELSKMSTDAITIAISDTGIGLSPADASKLFQPFTQIDSALNRKYQGTGLGLTLVKRIVELHGGVVTLSSEVGVGSCFSIQIPCQAES